MLSDRRCRQSPDGRIGDSAKGVNSACLPSCVAAPGLLAARAVEGGAAGLDEAGDRSGAARGDAGLPLSVVDLEGMLEIAKRAVDPGMIAQGGAPRLDRLVQHVSDHLGQAMRLFGGPSRRRGE